MELIILKNNEPMTTSLNISQGIGIEHRAILQLIKKYKDRKIFQSSAFEMQKISTKGRKGEVYFLNEGQSMFLITLMKNSDIVLDFKEHLVNAFLKYRRIAQQKYIQSQNAEYQIKRLESKTIRRECTDTIKEFIEYAVNQGSKNAVRYYANLAKMELKGLFLLESHFGSARDFMTTKQLNLIEMADEAIKMTLEHGMSMNMPYKEIYLLAKSKIEDIAKIFPPSPLPMLLEKESTAI